MADVFTVYCHGTGSNRDKHTETEIVNYFGRRADDEEYDDWLMLDGVGSKPKKHPLAGTFVYDENAPYYKKLIDKKDLKMKQKNPLMAMAVGSGVNGNVAFALEVLTRRPKVPSVINMIGWSRGGVTAIRLANALSEQPQFRSVKINIVAIDPVAGGERGNDAKNRVLPKQVKNFLCILATGEKRSSFKPQDAERIVASRSCNVVMLPFPGVHDTVAKLADGPRGLVSQVVFAIAGQFLEHFGSVPRQQGPIMDDLDYLQYYAEMIVRLDEYKKLRVGKIKGARLTDRAVSKGTLTTRDFAKHLDQYVIDPENFINIHHRRCFKSCYPNLFGYIYQSDKGKIDKRKVEPEFLSAPEVVQRCVLKQMATISGEEENDVYQLHQGIFEEERAERIIYRGSLHAMGILDSFDQMHKRGG